MTTHVPQFNVKRLRSQLYELRREGFQEVNLARLPALMAIAEHLAPDEPDPRRQLEISIDRAISGLPEEQKTARVWFGLDEASRGKDKDSRTALAAAVPVVTPESFKSHRQSDLIEATRIALLHLYDRPDDPAKEKDHKKSLGPLLERAAEATRPAEHKRRLRVVLAQPKRPKLLWLGIAVGAAICTVYLLWVFLTGETGRGLDPTKEVPPTGTVINAKDGSVVTHPNKSPIGQLITEPAGGSFRACDLTEVRDKTSCRFPTVNGPIQVEKGDTLWLGRSLREQGEVPLPFVTLIARRRWKGNHSARAEMVVEWPGVSHGKEREASQILFEMPGQYGYVNLVYVPDSTELRGPSWHDFIAHLPDGIMEGGISLANLGPPVSCFECFTHYKRYVFYKVRLEGYDPPEG